MTRVFGSLVAMMTLAACDPVVSVTPLNPSPRPLVRRPAASVEMYTTMVPKRPYIEIAALSASRGDASEHLAALREAAGAIGCDALLVLVAPSTSTGVVAFGGNAGAAASTNGATATCVVWDSDLD